MTTAGYATLDVIPSVKGLRSSLEKQTAGDLAAAGRVGGARFGAAAGIEAGSSFRARFSGYMKGFAPFAGVLGGAAVASFFKSAIDNASDLAETTTKVQVVFGDAADQVRAFGDDASASIGQSEQQALSAAGTFGNLLRSVGLTEQASADMSTTMVQLASDLASFNNTPIDQAIEALRSGLVGETEPLKTFGVNLNETVLKAEALRQGLSDGKSVLDANAKAQAAYALIMKQTALAQGDFVRTSDGLANQQRILSSQWDELSASVGTKLLPVVTDFVQFLNDDGIPALEAAGGVAQDVGSAFAGLPAPVKAAAGAFAALRVSSALGLTANFASGVSTIRSGLDSIRGRAVETAAAYRELRAASITAVGEGYKFNAGAGRISASLGAISTAASGAGSALRRGLSGALGLVGGPWGAAFIAGTAVLTHFWQESQEAKARVNELTDSLNQQTGAITKNTKELAFKNLQDSGALDLAKRYGIELDTLRDAALGNADAQAAINSALDDQMAAFAASIPAQQRASAAAGQFTTGIAHLREAIGTQNEELVKARDGLEDYATFMGRGESAASGMEAVTVDYASALTDAKKALEGLLDAEEERHDNAVQSKRDQLALISTLRDAREEARKGEKTLDENTKAGRNNWQALLDLSDQWNNSTPKVQNARGAYQDMRKEFIDLAEQMGATQEKAKRLAEKLLEVPKNTPVKFQTEGYREAMAEIEALKAAAAGFSTTLDLTPRGPGSTGNTVPETQPSGGGGGKRGRRTSGTSSQKSSGGVQINVQNMNVTDKKSAEGWATESSQQAAMGGYGGTRR